MESGKSGLDVCFFGAFISWCGLFVVMRVCKDCRPIIGENRQLITDEPVKFEKEPVEVGDCKIITDHFRIIYRIYPDIIKENHRMWTCNRLRMASHYTWGSVTTLDDFGGVLGRWPLDTFFWAITISWSRLLARVWSGLSFESAF